METKEYIMQRKLVCSRDIGPNNTGLFGMEVFLLCFGLSDLKMIH